MGSYVTWILYNIYIINMGAGFLNCCGLKATTLSRIPRCEDLATPDRAAIIHLVDLFLNYWPEPKIEWCATCRLGRINIEHKHPVRLHLVGYRPLHCQVYPGVSIAPGKVGTHSAKATDALTQEEARFLTLKWANFNFQIIYQKKTFFLKAMHKSWASLEGW